MRNSSCIHVWFYGYRYGGCACIRACLYMTELDSTNILRWLVIHNMRLHPHYEPPGKQWITSAQEVFLRERSFYHMIYDFLRYFLFLAFVLAMVNMRRDYDIFLRNDSVYRQVFNDPQFQSVRISIYWSLLQACLLRRSVCTFLSYMHCSVF